MATINYLNPKTSGGGGAATAAAGGYLGPNDSGEQLPEPVPKPYVRHQVIQVDPVHPVYGRGPTRLQKSNSTIRRGVPELLPVPGPSDSHELAGDDLAAISEMDTESPSRRVSTWTTNPFVAAEQEANEALPSSSVAEREAAYFRTHSRDNSRDFPPYADNPAVTIETASITSSEERSDLLGRGESFDSDPDSIGPVGPPSSPPDSPNWVSMPLSNQERAMDANANPSAPGFGFSSSRTPANIPPALLAGGLRNMRGSPLPFSPRWRRNGHVPERKPSPPTPAFHRPSPVTDSPFRENFAKFNQSSSPVYSVPGVSPLTPSRSNPSPLLRNRIAEENRYLAEPTVHYPSWSEISEFNFADRPQTAGSQREEDGGDGWRPVTSRSYEMAL
ncbi:hypothetical protein HII31_08877 [Pseudocercospora fuligena]|uniref:Uncharacterized protein n=1 Tax=Pseudocercospora fuligena TaxID=685502 RepID=A0A8H6VK74_9PEZI|nr:hypothetical protein HII31_08877 [Pseudocercospora fuligena]